jgi:hypothetical protein
MHIMQVIHALPVMQVMQVMQINKRLADCALYIIQISQTSKAIHA